MRLMRFLLATVLMLSMMLTAEAKTPEEFAAERNGYAALKSMLEAPRSRADCVSTMELVMHCPFAHSELKIRGLERPSQKSEINIGSFDVNLALGIETVNFNVPFYLVEEADDVSFYFNLDNKWKKIAVKNTAINSADELDGTFMLDLLDRAELLSDVGGQQIVRASFDCKKIAALLDNFKADEKVLPDKISEQDKEKALAIAKSMNEALIKTGTLDAIFNIDAETKRPLMVEFDATPAFRNVLGALGAVEESKTMGLSPILNVLASTVQVKMYAVNDFSGKFDAKEFVLPKKVLKAEDITKDFLPKTKTESTKTR